MTHQTRRTALKKIGATIAATCASFSLPVPAQLFASDNSKKPIRLGVIADLHVALFDAVREGDLKRAQFINDRIFPTAQCFYAPPETDMHNRMKTALLMLGRMPNAVVRPPLTNLSEDELTKIQKAVQDAGLSYEGANILCSHTCFNIFIF